MGRTQDAETEKAGGASVSLKSDKIKRAAIDAVTARFNMHASNPGRGVSCVVGVKLIDGPRQIMLSTDEIVRLNTTKGALRIRVEELINEAEKRAR